MRREYMLALLVVIFTIQALPPVSNAEQMQTAATGVSLTIDFENGTVLSFDGLNGQTVLDITQSVADVQIEWFGDLAFVTAIDGVSNDASSDKWWQYWVNDEYASVACNKYQLNDNDSVVWRRHGSVITRTSPVNDDPSLVVGGLILGLVGFVSIIILYHRGARV